MVTLFVDSGVSFHQKFFAGRIEAIMCIQINLKSTQNVKATSSHGNTTNWKCKYFHVAAETQMACTSARPLHQVTIPFSWIFTLHKKQVCYVLLDLNLTALKLYYFLSDLQKSTFTFILPNLECNFTFNTQLGLHFHVIFFSIFLLNSDCIRTRSLVRWSGWQSSVLTGVLFQR